MVAAQENGRWICSETGIWTRDSMDWFGPDNEPIRTPRSVSFYCWAIYSTWKDWVSLADEWLKVKGDREKLIAFINTTRGEASERRRHCWPARFPASPGDPLTGRVQHRADRTRPYRG